MIKKFWAFIAARRWRYVGGVQAISRKVRDDGWRVPGGESRGYWILEQRGDGKRRATPIGDAGSSPSANWTRAAIEAWVRGGPLPPLSDEFRPGADTRGKLIAIGGGKDGAA